MNYIKPKDFIDRSKGMSVDYDHVYGVQCVDGIKYFNSLIYGKADFNCGTCGYAYGLFGNYGSNGVEKYFDKGLFKEVQIGDWVVWNWGSKQCPNSHVAMYVEKISDTKIRCWGEGSGKGFSYQEIDIDGILGTLRPKIYSQNISTYLAPKGYLSKGDTSYKVENICKWFGETKLFGNYFGNYLESVVKVYQKQKGKEKLGDADGNIGPRTLSAMVEDGFKL